MRKIVFILLFVLCNSFLFGRSAQAEKLFNEALEYEANNDWFNAAVSYFEVVNIDPLNSEDAYDRFNEIVDAFSDGKPGLAEYDEFTIYDYWVDIMKSAEKYFTDNLPFNVVFYPLNKGELNRENRTATFNCTYKLNQSDVFRYIGNPIQRGIQIAKKTDWNLSETFTWPKHSIYGQLKFKIDHGASKSFDDFFTVPENFNNEEFIINGVPVVAFGCFNAVDTIAISAYEDDECNYIADIRNTCFDTALFSVTVHLVDENGNEVGKSCVSKGQRNTFNANFSDVPSNRFSDVQNGKIIPEVVSIQTYYGKVYDAGNINIGKTSIPQNFYGEKINLAKKSCWKFTKCLMEINKTYKSIENSIVKLPISENVIIGMEEPVLSIPDIGPKPELEPEPKYIEFWNKKKDLKARTERYNIALQEYEKKSAEVKLQAENEFKIKSEEYEKALTEDPRLKYNWYYIILERDTVKKPKQYVETINNSGVDGYNRNSSSYLNYGVAVLNKDLLQNKEDRLLVYPSEYTGSDFIYKNEYFEIAVATDFRIIRKSEGKPSFTNPDNFLTPYYREANKDEIEKLGIPLGRFKIDYYNSEEFPMTSDGKKGIVFIIAEPK